MAVTLRDAVAWAWRSAPLILAATVVAGLVATFLAYALPPTYTANATVLVERGKDPTLRTELTTLSVENTEAIETEIALMRSATVALAVIDRLGLDRRQRRPSALRDAIDGIGQTLAGLGLIDLPERREAVLRGYLKTIRCKQPPLTWMVNLSFSAEDPADAAAVLAAHLDAYLEHRRSVYLNTATDFFRRRVAEVEAELGQRRAERERLTDPAARARLDLEMRALEASFLANRERLDRTVAEAGADRSLVNVRVVDPPRQPGRPNLPRLLLIVAGLVAGGALGVGMALLRGWFDHGLRTPDDLRRVGIEPLGFVREDRNLRRRP